MAELNQTPEEEEVVPHVVQLISPPFLGRTVLTAGPAKFGMDLTKQEHGVSFHRDNDVVINIEASTCNKMTKNFKCYNYFADFSQAIQMLAVLFYLQSPSHLKKHSHLQ